jgi:hypothetical protein
MGDFLFILMRVTSPMRAVQLGVQPAVSEESECFGNDSSEKQLTPKPCNMNSLHIFFRERKPSP